MRISDWSSDVCSSDLRRQLEKLGVEVRTGTPVNAIDADGVLLGDEPIAARTVLWAAGVAASKLARALDVPLDRAEIGSASCRERVFQYVESQVGAVSIKKKQLKP